MNASIRNEQILCKMASLYSFRMKHILHNRVIIHLTGLQSSSPELQNNGVVKKMHLFFIQRGKKLSILAFVRLLNTFPFSFFFR